MPDSGEVVVGHPRGADPYAHLAGVYDDVVVVDPCFASWADFAVATWADGPVRVRRVLDVCCGTGLMTAELVARGLDVVGLDASAAMLALARGRLGTAVPLVRTTLPHLAPDPHLAGPFDAMVSTLDGLNYLDPADLRRTLAALGGLLRPGGWLVFDLHADALIALARDNPVVLGTAGDCRYAVTYVVDERARTCRSIMSLQSDVDPSRDFVEEHLQYLHRDREVRAAVVAAGLVVVRVVDEYSPTPANPTTLRATWVVQRPVAGRLPV